MRSEYTSFQKPPQKYHRQPAQGLLDEANPAPLLKAGGKRCQPNLIQQLPPLQAAQLQLIHSCLLLLIQLRG